MCLTGGRTVRWRVRWRGASATPRVGSSSGWLAIFGRDNCFVEIQRHLERAQERDLARLVAPGSRGRALPLLATNQPLYCRPGGRAVADVFTCIREKTDLDHAGRRLTRNGERELKGGLEMARRFRDLPEALANSGELALRLAFTLKNLGYRFPEFPAAAARRRPTSICATLAREGARDRYGDGPLAVRARRQIAHELEVIGRLDLAGYFLIVWDIVEFCREQRHPGAGARLGRQQRGLLRARASPPSIRWAWICCSSGFSRRRAASGRTSTSTCRAASGGSRSSSTSIGATAATAPA